MKLAVKVVIALAAIGAGGYFVADAFLSNAFADVGPAIEVGKPMPKFTMNDTTGKEHSLEQYKGKIVVLNFCSQKCPFSRGADSDLNALAKEFKDDGVVFLGIDSHKATPPDEINEHIEEAKVPYPILKDEGNEYADAVGARVTPELYIVDKEGILRYHGAPDNRAGPEAEPSKHYAKDALNALVAGEEVEVANVKAWGCGIKRVG